MTTAANDIELMAQRRETLAFISSAPRQVVLTRREQTKNIRGGLTTGDPSVLPPQTMRILHAPPRRRRKENTPFDQSVGEYSFAKDYLMGRWDADIQLGDTCTIDGVAYTISYVFNNRSYEVLANLETMDQVGV